MKPKLSFTVSLAEHPRVEFTGNYEWSLEETGLLLFESTEDGEPDYAFNWEHVITFVSRRAS